MTEFSRRYGIPVSTLNKWDRRKSEPDAAVIDYLKVNQAEPDIVGRALANSTSPQAAE